MLLVILKAKKLLEDFMKKNNKEQNKEFCIDKVIKRTGNKLYVKWKAYSNSFNSWIDKKDMVLMNSYFRKPKSLGANV